ncbi:VacB/RNase II family 3'-5' exoribonuclease [Halioxenophilus sp. WMMB6]|uniref:VacB/RNase II family 3'-5' exoribonuclease n=1 Tax=Halioxenophilus sp. WMMB6 TaxID=3073815 RepID=UPI00295E68F3|nr:VacB/RNase II family 3'-5' exoribonuclease [Halioxenophilus sp. WMMB6]
MLNSDALNQLSQLKQTIRASKDYAEGTVRGSKGRFGFVILDDGREAFLDPEQMQRVFPGDRVEVSVSQNAKEQWEATLEKLLSSELKEFVGYYLERGKGHFAVPDVPMLSRWIFLPPKQRGQAKDTDFIRCKITRHPFGDGKGQAKVLETIGARSDKQIERRYTISKFQLRDGWSDEQLKEAESVASNPQALDSDQLPRVDLTALPLVTIDAATTLDMDDAVFGQATENGWQLTVAIADPSAGIALQSSLGKEAMLRGQTVYLPGNSATMIPDQLSHHSYSLIMGEARPTIVATLDIQPDGAINNCQFQLATISSKAKLTYEAVSEFLDKGTVEPAMDETITASLTALNAIAVARFNYREQNALVMEERPDYDFRVNEQGKIETIVKYERNSAQRLVEEAMLAANLSAGHYFAEHKLPALFSSHLGFKSDRLAQVQKLLGEDLGEFSGDVSELDCYQQLIQQLQGDPAKASLLAVLKRQLRPSELSTEPKPHLGLGFPVYANITSPIRRFNDLYNHLLLKQSLGGEPVAAIDEASLQALREQNSTSRSACRQLELWLLSQYMQAFIGQTFTGRVAMVNSQGIGVRLDDNGVDTYVQLRDRKNKAQAIDFNPDRLTLTLDGKTFLLDESVTVAITGIDEDRRQVLAELVAGE